MKLKKWLLPALACIAVFAAVPAHADTYQDLGYNPSLGYGLCVQWHDGGGVTVWWYDNHGNFDSLSDSQPLNY